MKKFLAASIILFLIFFTAVIKNSTKRIDDDIFTFKENVRVLKEEFGDLIFEYNYLSSGNKLMEFQSEHFEEYLDFKKLNKISFIDINKKKVIIKKLNINKSD